MEIHLDFCGKLLNALLTTEGDFLLEKGIFGAMHCT